MTRNTLREEGVEFTRSHPNCKHDQADSVRQNRIPRPLYEKRGRGILGESKGYFPTTGRKTAYGAVACTGPWGVRTPFRSTSSRV